MLTGSADIGFATDTTNAAKIANYKVHVLILALRAIRYGSGIRNATNAQMI